MKKIKQLFRWMLNKDELDHIRHEVMLLRMLVSNEIERQQPKRTYPIGPIGPVKNK
jgi:hypothetical protein